MERYLAHNIDQDLRGKIVLMSGPRQAGKTTLSKQLRPNYSYLNYDFAEHRTALQERSWDRDASLVVFDELHKLRNWKSWLKGIYDVEGINPNIVVTGSAKMDVHRKVGDSLAGRYFQYRLHPFDLKELALIGYQDSTKNFETLMTCSGFPEPFLQGTREYYQRWRRTHIDIILRQDLLDLNSVRDIKSIETLVVMLRDRVGSSVSIANLARDLERDAKTVKFWLELLENLYVIFRVSPYSKDIARSLLKEPKYYFYDYAYMGDQNPGAKLENFVASSLLKELHYLEDTTGIKAKLHYLRTKDGKELDFLVTLEDEAAYMIEVKSSDTAPAKAFKHFANFLPQAKKIQLVETIAREKTFPDGIQVRSLVPWMTQLDLTGR